MVMGLDSRIFLASHSDSRSFLVVYSFSAKMDSSKEDSGRLVGYVVSPFDLPEIILVGGGLLVLFLPGCHLIK